MDATAAPSPSLVSAGLASHQAQADGSAMAEVVQTITTRRSVANGIRLGPRVRPRAASPPDQSRARMTRMD